MGGEANKQSAEINTLVEQNMVATEQAMMLKDIRRDLEGRQGDQILRPSWPELDDSKDKEQDSKLPVKQRKGLNAGLGPNESL